MHFALRTFVIALTILQVTPSALAQSKTIHGMYARHAVPVYEFILEKGLEFKVVSPDGSKTILISYAPESAVMDLTLTNGSAKHVWHLGVSVGAEILWAPDSRAFFVTRSPAGGSGIYFCVVYLLVGEEVKVLDATPIIYEVFGHPVKCAVPEPPNVAGVAWDGDSRQLLIAAEIVGHANCDSNGTFQLYEITLPELKVVKNYGQIEAKKLFWESLGRELRLADDNCIRHPQSCVVNSFSAPRTN